MPSGLTTVLIRLMGGTMSRATSSALVTPMDLGSSSTKKRVTVVRATAPHVSPRAPKTEDAKRVKMVVALQRSVRRSVCVMCIAERIRVNTKIK